MASKVPVFKSKTKSLVASKIPVFKSKTKSLEASKIPVFKSKTKSLVLLNVGQSRVEAPSRLAKLVTGIE